MIGQAWYHKSIKKVISVFGSLFSDISITSGTGDVIKVPIHFSQKQKFIEALFNNEDVRNMHVDITTPALGFEIVNYLYNPEQMSNPMNIQHQKISADNQSIDFMFSSVPYTIGIELYAMTNTLDEAYQIIEQIIPFFTPQLTVTIKDLDLYSLNTNITFDLNAISQDVQYETTFDERRSIMINFSFSAHTKFHSNPRSIERIKDVIVNMTEKDHEETFDRLLGTRQLDGEFKWSNS